MQFLMRRAAARLAHPLCGGGQPLGPLGLVDLGVDPPGPEAEEHVEAEADDAGSGHDDEDEAVAVSAGAGVATAGHLGGLRVVEESREEAREEEGSERQVEDEDVVDEAVVLEAEQLRRRGHGDRQPHAVADADHHRADEEGSRHAERHQHVPCAHEHLRRRVPHGPRQRPRLDEVLGDGARGDAAEEAPDAGHGDEEGDVGVAHGHAHLPQVVHHRQPRAHPHQERREEHPEVHRRRWRCRRANSSSSSSGSLSLSL